MRRPKLLCVLLWILGSSPMPYFDFSPVTGAGLHSERPGYQTQWQKLQNFIFRRGRLVSRPGTAEITAQPLVSVENSVPQVITEVLNPRASTTGGRVQNILETQRPTAEGLCTDNFVPIGDADLALVLDDNPPDDGATLARVAVSAGFGRFTLDRADVVTTYEAIDSITVRTRVRFTDPSYAGFAVVRFGLGVCDSSKQVTRAFAVYPGATGWVELQAVLPTARAITAAIPGFGDGDGNFADSPWTTTILNEPVIADRPAFFFRVDFVDAPGPAAGDFEIDYIALGISGLDTDTTATDGIIGVDRVYMTSHSFEKLVDETSFTGFTDVRGAVALPTGDMFDYSQLYGQLYVVNGVDQIYRYPTALGVFEQFAGKPFGKTVLGFDGRVHLGWVTDGGSTVPERVRFSVKGDGSDYTGVGSGFFDALAAPGGVSKLEALTEDIYALYKQQSIWLVRRTGDDSAPYIPDVIDAQTGLLALRTVKTTITAQGTPVQYFLGRNPVDGISVFRFDGSTVVNVGKGLTKFLQDDANHEVIHYAHAGIDPDTGTYWLFIPEGQDTSIPQKAWAMDIRTEEWTGPLTFQNFYSALGTWRLKAGSTPRPNGVSKLILGRADDGRPYKLDFTVGTDAQPEGLPVGNTEVTVDIVPVLETGDIRLTEPQLQTIPYSFHVLYVDHGEFTVNLDVSTDGGTTFNTAVSFDLGGISAGSLQYAKLDDTVTQTRRTRFRARFTPTGVNPMSKVEIEEAWVYFETGGDDA